MAVIVRSPGSLTSAIRRAFAQVSIPVAGELEALATNASIAPFLLLAEIAIKAKPLNTENVERLLLSEFGGADAISLRRIRRALLASRTDDDKRTGNQLLIEAVDTVDISIEGAQPIQRINLLLTKARSVAKKSGARGEDLLWAIWDNAQTSDGAKLSTAWQEIALRGGNRGAAADRDLDAMMQLFQSAQRFSERFPLSGADAFIREVSAEIIAGDVIPHKVFAPIALKFLQFMQQRDASGISLQWVDYKRVYGPTYVNVVRCLAQKDWSNANVTEIWLAQNSMSLQPVLS
jgi:hypothetical protein